jgi:hypothetical protein
MATVPLPAAGSNVTVARIVLLACNGWPSSVTVPVTSDLELPQPERAAVASTTRADARVEQWRRAILG